VKLGFSLPPDLEARLPRHIPWGSKQRVIEGLLRALVNRLDKGDHSLWTEAMAAYFESHHPTSARELRPALDGRGLLVLPQSSSTSKAGARAQSVRTASAKAGRSK